MQIFHTENVRVKHKALISHSGLYLNTENYKLELKNIAATAYEPTHDSQLIINYVSDHFNRN
jgi:hypothetical protein